MKMTFRKTTDESKIPTILVFLNINKTAAKPQQNLSESNTIWKFPSRSKIKYLYQDLQICCTKYWVPEDRIVL